ncbi:hypothetical protein ASPBRDRAFT_44092 [Aspergillus brasiliensis CBS 101740]|uniref:Uncharacterized protein n=1 Tax=Aspergillus brasiliensis (strain CBS 101740 / IMI 381727 / IBT 21946) TaxID=767769 RepID=A0A1L9UHL8_ASPBC|nr:hypothetical protein ASPBRDRAFT_44092 [Aspergillus brasiliensis CBS 101740]
MREGRAIRSGNDRLEGGRLLRDPQVPDSPINRRESNCWSVRDAPLAGQVSRPLLQALSNNQMKQIELQN